MIEHVWSVLCSHSLYDSESNNASLINTLEQINLTKGTRFPAQIALSLDLVSLWIRVPHSKPTKGTARVILLSPSKEETKPVEVPLDLSKSERHRTRVRSFGLPVNEPGYHYFLVQYREKGQKRWKDAAKLPLSIRLIEKSEIK